MLNTQIFYMGSGYINTVLKKEWNVFYECKFFCFLCWFFCSNLEQICCSLSHNVINVCGVWNSNDGILRSSFFSRSLDSSVDRVDNFCFRFWRHLLEARLFRSLMRRYFWSPEQPGSPLVMDDSEVMLKLEETLRHLALKIEQKFHFKHIIKGPFINDVMQIWPQNCVVQKWLQKSGYSPPPKLCNVVFNVSYNEFKRWIKIHFPPMGKFSIWLW